MQKSKNIILIHGNFVNDVTWAEWKKYYEQKGYKVHTPANPGHGGNPTELRKNVHPDLVKTGFIDVVNNISKLIDTLSGGLQVLRVFDRDLVDNSPRRKFWRRLDHSDVAILERRLPPEVLIDGGRWEIIRRRQTLDDVLALEA